MYKYKSVYTRILNNWIFFIIFVGMRKAAIYTSLAVVSSILLSSCSSTQLWQADDDMYLSSAELGSSRMYAGLPASSNSSSPFSERPAQNAPQQTQEDYYSSDAEITGDYYDPVVASGLRTRNFSHSPAHAYNNPHHGHPSMWNPRFSMSMGMGYGMGMMHPYSSMGMGFGMGYPGGTNIHIGYGRGMMGYYDPFMNPWNDPFMNPWNDPFMNPYNSWHHPHSMWGNPYYGSPYWRSPIIPHTPPRRISPSPRPGSVNPNPGGRNNISPRDSRSTNTTPGAPVKRSNESYGSPSNRPNNRAVEGRPGVPRQPGYNPSSRPQRTSPSQQRSAPQQRPAQRQMPQQRQSPSSRPMPRERSVPSTRPSNNNRMSSPSSRPSSMPSRSGGGGGSMSRPSSSPRR